MSHREFAVTTAKKASVIMRKYFRSTENLKDWKLDDTPVTIADREINEYVATEIRQMYPTYGFIGEEGSMYNDENYVWVCDPIDGTRSYARGIPVATFSLALLKDGEPILGVVYQPFVDEMYIGEKGKGSSLNGKKIHVSSISQIDKEVILACPTHRVNAPVQLESKLIELAKFGANTYNYGSGAYNAVLVARGSVEGTIFPWSHCWDMAAAKVIIEEAGGKTSGIFGGKQKYNQDIQGFIGSNGLLHENFLIGNPKNS